MAAQLTPRGVRWYNCAESRRRRDLIDQIRSFLILCGYQEVEVPTLIPTRIVESATEGTENRMFSVANGVSLMPETTNYIRSLGRERLGTNKVFYVARCFRDETTTNATRLREFTQIGVELLGGNPLDCFKTVKYDAIQLFVELERSPCSFNTVRDPQRGLNLYTGKTFEITNLEHLQLCGGGVYEGGAGWALGLERVQAFTGRI